MIAALAGVAHQIERDASLDAHAAASRDLALRPSLARYRGRPARQLRAWAEAASGDGGEQCARTRAALLSVSAAMTVLGLALGAGAAGVVFRYDGAAPVNVMLVLWVFVVAHLALVALVLVAWLPRRWLRRVPPADALVRAMAAIGPGALWQLAARIVPAAARARLEDALAGGARHGRLHGEVYRWQLLRWSQVAALAFQLGVVSVFTVKVATEDMAFAWSTQVEAIAEHMPAAVHALSASWAGAWPDASPAPAFVEATRYSRLRGGEFSRGGAPDAITLGRWWPFVMACLLVYGLLPRVVTYAVCAVRARRAAMWAVAHLPGADLVLQRLNEVQVRTAHEGPLPAAWRSDPSAAGSARSPFAPQAFVNWSEAPARALPFPVVIEQSMGGRNTPRDDERALARVVECVRTGAAKGVVIGVRAWEAPTEALFDIVRALRAALDPGTSISLLPLCAPGEAERVAQWAAHASRLGDPWLHVVGDARPTDAPSAD